MAIVTNIFDFPFLYEPPVHRLKSWIYSKLLGAHIDRDCFIHRGVRSTNWKNIYIGRFSYISEDVDFRAAGSIYIGSYTTISPHVIFCSGGHNTINLASTADSIKIGDGVFIGAGAILLQGVTIGDHVIIGAGSIVTKSISTLDIVGGNPAKVIGKREMPKEVWTLFGTKKI